MYVRSPSSPLDTYSTLLLSQVNSSPSHIETSVARIRMKPLDRDIGSSNAQYFIQAFRLCSALHFDMENMAVYNPSILPP
jgi:hypothetical protein